MRNRSFKLVLGMALVLTAGWSAARPAHASGSAYTVVTEVPITRIQYVDCANGGAGETIVLSGNIHAVFHLTTDGNGGVAINQALAVSGVTATGETTGTVYHGTGTFRDQLNTRIGEQANFISNFRVISDGPGGNLLLHENFHETVNPDGTVTAFVDNFSLTCE